jgi:hypothetical protein
MGLWCRGKHATGITRETPQEQQFEGSTTVNVAVRAVPAGCNPRPTATLLPVASLSARPDEGTRSIGCANNPGLITRGRSLEDEERVQLPLAPAPLTVNRRQFLTALLIAPAIRIGRAYHTISFSELVSTTLKRYHPSLMRNLQQGNTKLLKMMKEKLQ